MAEFQARNDELVGLGFGLLALSVDEPRRSAAFAEQNGLRFPLLCDTRHEVVQRWGLYNASEKGGLAFPATYVLDRERRVRFRSLDRTATRVELGSLFEHLRDASAPVVVRRGRRFPRVLDWLRSWINQIRFGVRSPRG